MVENIFPDNSVKLSTREKLIHSATLELCEFSYFGTDSNRIAKRAGVAAGSFYNHFHSKLEVFLEVFTHYADRERVDVFSHLRATPDRIKPSFESVAKVLIERRKQSAKLRASLEMLTRTEQAVVDARYLNQQKTIDLLWQGSSKPCTHDVKSRIGLHFLVINAITDSIATDRYTHFGIVLAEATARIEQELEAVWRICTDNS
jgi:AcrR family transcriptional regulator